MSKFVISESIQMFIRNYNMACNRLLLFLVITFSTLGIFSLNAQQKAKFFIESFEQNQFDTSARDKATEKYDGNGDRYSIIKVTSTNPDDDLMAYNFDFGMMNSLIEQHDDELWVYVQRNAKHVTIKRAGYVTVRNYDLGTTVQPGNVYNMLFSVTLPKVYKQMVQFNIKPAQAGIVVMYKSSKPNAQEILFGTTDENGSVAKNLELGTYTYKVISDKYHLCEGRLVLKEKNKTFTEDVVLTPNFAHVILKTKDSVEIYINDEFISMGSWSGTLPAGVHQIESRLAKHSSVIDVVEIEENVPRIIELKHPSPITGVLAITSHPLGADISIDGKNYGVTPQNIDGLIIGTHEVTITKTNYKTEYRTVIIKENDITELDVELKDMANMSIVTNPTGADLYINGKFVGVTPYNSEMASGDYDLVIKKDKYHRFEGRVHFDSSTPKMSFSLKRQYQQKNSIYAQASYQLGGLSGVGAHIGRYIHNVNVEAFVTKGMTEETIYVNYSDEREPDEEKLSAMILGGKVGYGFIIGTRIRVTPQLGVAALSVSSDALASSAICASLGVRGEYALTNFLGVSLTPEYSVALSKKKIFETLSSLSSNVKGWGDGVNIRLGVYLNF